MKDWLPLIGVVVAQFVLVGLYFAKVRADDKRRWHEKRLDAYRGLVKAAGDAAIAFSQVEEVDDLDDMRFVTAHNEAEACSLDIALLSTWSVRLKADALTILLELIVAGNTTSPGFPTPESLLFARLDFENAVREELGIDRPQRRFAAAASSRLGLIGQTIRELSRPQHDYIGEQLTEALRPREKNSSADPEHSKS